MSNLLKTDWETIRHHSFRTTFEVLEQVFKSEGIDFFLIGALARDIWDGIHDIPHPAITRDIDIAIHVSGKAEFERVKNDLILNHTYRGSSKNQFVIISPEGVQVDLSPFGQITDQDQMVKVDGFGFSSISVEGFQEVYHRGIEIVEVEGSEFKICSIPGIVVLKLISWTDRPDRSTDVHDIYHLISNAFEFFEDEIYTSLHEMLTKADDALDYSAAVGAMVIGKKIHDLVAVNKSLHSKLKQIIAGEIRKEEKSDLILLVAQKHQKSIEEVTETYSYLHSQL